MDPEVEFDPEIELSAQLDVNTLQNTVNANLLYFNSAPLSLLALSIDRTYTLFHHSLV